MRGWWPPTSDYLPQTGPRPSSAVPNAHHTALRPAACPPASPRHRLTHPPRMPPPPHTLVCTRPGPHRRASPAFAGPRAPTAQASCSPSAPVEMHRFLFSPRSCFAWPEPAIPSPAGRPTMRAPPLPPCLLMPPTPPPLPLVDPSPRPQSIAGNRQSPHPAASPSAASAATHPHRSAPAATGFPAASLEQSPARTIRPPTIPAWYPTPVRPSEPSASTNGTHNTSITPAGSWPRKTRCQRSVPAARRRSERLQVGIVPSFILVDCGSAKVINTDCDVIAIYCLPSTAYEIGELTIRAPVW